MAPDASQQSAVDAAVGGKPDRLSREEINQLVAGLGDLAGILRNADPADKNAIYTELGLTLTYQPAANKIIAQTEPGRSCNKTCPRGDLPEDHMPILRTEFVVGEVR